MKKIIKETIKHQCENCLSEWETDVWDRICVTCGKSICYNCGKYLFVIGDVWLCNECIKEIKKTAI
jgi:hypothetical protein